MAETQYLSLPVMEAGQGQKHVTFNEAMRILDASVQVSVLDRNLSAPPGSPAEGDRYLVAAGGSGVWLGWDGDIASFLDGVWVRVTVLPGWVIHVADEDVPLVKLAGAGLQKLLFEGQPLLVPDGTVGAPGWRFSADPDNGFYRKGANNYAAAAGGQEVVDILSTGIDVKGAVKRRGRDLAWERVASSDGSTSVANVDVSWSGLTLTDYHAIKLVVDELVLATDGASLEGQVFQGGVVRATGAYFGGNTVNGVGGSPYGGATAIALFPNAEVGTADEGIFGEISVRTFPGKRPIIRHELAGGYNDAVPIAMVVGISKWNGDVGLLDGFRFKASAGNITRWSVRVLGLRKST